MSETRSHRGKRQKSEILVTLGQAMRSARRERGLSQEKFAALVGLDRSYYGAIERGEYKISISTVRTIAFGLEMTASELMARARL